MKIALIGVGVIGKVHLNVISNTDEQIVGICDIDESKLLDFDSKIAYKDYKKMLDETNPEIVHICTPHYLHKEMIIYALKKNINVFCEKPVCINYEEIEEIKNVLKSSSAQLGICYQNRYNPVIEFVKNYLKDRKVESIFGYLLWHRDEAYYNQAFWRGKKQYEGGGVLINQAIHTIDLMQYFTSIPQSIIANVSNISLKGIIDVEDNAIISSTDGRFNLIASNSANKDFPVKIIINTKDEEIEVYKNFVRINNNTYDCGKLENLPFAKKIYGGGHNPIIKDYYECIKTNKKFSIDFHEAIKSLKIVLASYESKGKKIKIN